MLAEVIPALAVEPGADLHDPHIVVGIAETEPADVGPLVENEVRAEAEPDEDGDQLPVALDQLERAPLKFLVLALRHFSGCSQSTLNGKQPRHGDQIKLSPRDIRS